MAIKENEISAFPTAWLDLEGIMLSEISQSKKRQTPYDFTYMGNLKNKIKKLNRNRLINREQSDGCWRERGWGTR